MRGNGRRIPPGSTRHQRTPTDRARQQFLHGAGRGLDQVAGAEELGGDAIADPDVDDQHALEDEQSGTR